MSSSETFGFCFKEGGGELLVCQQRGLKMKAGALERQDLTATDII